MLVLPWNISPPGPPLHIGTRECFWAELAGQLMTQIEPEQSTCRVRPLTPTVLTLNPSYISWWYRAKAGAEINNHGRTLFRSQRCGLVSALTSGHIHELDPECSQTLFVNPWG